MKKIISLMMISLVCAFVSGCRSQSCETRTENISVMGSRQSDFGNEQYIWESWIFPNVNK